MADDQALGGSSTGAASSTADTLLDFSGTLAPVAAAPTGRVVVQTGGRFPVALGEKSVARTGFVTALQRPPRTRNTLGWPADGQALRLEVLSSDEREYYLGVYENVPMLPMPRLFQYQFTAKPGTVTAPFHHFVHIVSGVPDFEGGARVTPDRIRNISVTLADGKNGPFHLVIKEITVDTTELHE